MGIIRIDENNLWKYGDYIEPDAAEELKRYYHRGVVITELVIFPAPGFSAY